ncbi:Hypothetical protein FKW44_013694, partial [Caligus rogercresseyi]
KRMTNGSPTRGREEGSSIHGICSLRCDFGSRACPLPNISSSSTLLWTHIGQNNFTILNDSIHK